MISTYPQNFNTSRDIISRKALLYNWHYSTSAAHTRKQLCKKTTHILSSPGKHRLNWLSLFFIRTSLL